MLAADYPFLDIFWTMLIFFAWVIWFFMLIRILGDVFRRKDTNGVKKVIWITFLIVTPFVGVFFYLITQGDKMAGRDADNARSAQAEFDQYVRTAAGSGGPATEIEKAKALLDSGAISADEFARLKAAALG